MKLPVVGYPGLALRALRAAFPSPLAAVPSPPWLLELLNMQADVPVRGDERVRVAVRDLLRRHGYRPTGRGKPSSEYLVAAVAGGRLGPINAAVDAGNAVSLHCGLPISVVDLARCQPPLRVDVPPPGSSYVFNRGGQSIDVGGLVSLGDAEGPCANAVKDAQRTKTSPETTAVLAIVWGVELLGSDHAETAAAWLRDVLLRLGAGVEVVATAGLE